MHTMDHHHGHHLDSTIGSADSTDSTNAAESSSSQPSPGAPPPSITVLGLAAANGKPSSSSSDAFTGNDTGNSGIETEARSSATAYSLDAAHLRERVTTVGRLPTASASSRRLAALFGTWPSSTTPSPSASSSTSTSSSSAPASAHNSSQPPNSPMSMDSPTHQPHTQPTPPSTAQPAATAPPKPEPIDSTHAHRPGPGSGLFECNICLDTASDPVVTLCGHLFCWPCLDPWFKSCAARHTALTCPVCKSGCGPDKTIPIFARGREAFDPRKAATPVHTAESSAAGASGARTAAGAASPRPEAQRSEPVPPPRTWRNAWGLGGGMGGGGVQPNIQIGVFPGLFGMTINLGDGGAGGPEAMRGDPQDNTAWASALTLMGVMILMNLFFGLFLF